MSKCCVVTGASSGIGRDTAVVLAEKDWKVIAVARREELIVELEERYPEQIIACTADICHKDELMHVFDLAKERLGDIDLLVNNAGVSWLGEFESFPVEKMDALIDVNIKAMMMATQMAIPLLEKSESAQIINISSITAHVPMPSLAVYCASKAFVSMFSRVLARELKEKKIRVNALSPSGTETEIFEKIGSTTPVDSSGFIPSREMAKMIAWLTELPDHVDLEEVVVQQKYNIF